METLKEQLIQDEGICLRPYKCPAGKLTIGVGRNIEDNGITEDEAAYLLENDIARVRAELLMNVKDFYYLSIPRQRALVNMCFNLGITRFLKFKKMLAAIKGKDYELAAKEMLDSKWARQVGDRAKRISETMRTGV